MPTSIPSSLAAFHPAIADWFAGRLGSPTEIQAAAWRVIAGGEHCLISAATGSGKTLAAFLWGINQLASGAWGLGQTRVLYVSPLKALNNDIRRNLLTPLGELEQVFRSSGLDWPGIRVKTRSGDSDPGERRRMLRHPPEILITTPESLNLLLTSRDGRRSLLGIRCVILDEIHSVVGSKRGVYLMTAVERLARLTGEFQRVALSATVRPMETVAAFVGGLSEGKPRPVRLAQASLEKRYEISVALPEEPADADSDEEFWLPVVGELKRLVAQNRSTLIFVNSRMLCEKLAYLMNRDEPAPVAYSHHGSLSKEIRTAIEGRLKSGELKAIVATNSLEMGIDIGALDCVAMVQCPNQISSAIQKVGRAGHQVGAVSRAALFPSHSRDFLEAAVLSKAIRDRDIEAVRPIERPLDVLAQVIVSTLGPEDWDLDDLYQLFKGSYPYRDLSREEFDLVVEMLAGRYAGTRLRELKPRLSIDRTANRATLRKGALMAFYFSGGVIPDRGYFHLRLSGDGGRLGELDEEFVWERSVGDVFTLGVQSWKIDRITYNDVFVVPAQSVSVAPPFWKAERYNRDFHYSSRIGQFLEWTSERMDEAGFAAELRERFAMDENAAQALQEFLRSQKSATNRPIPHRRHLLVELVEAAPGGAPGAQLVLHTLWGGRVNRPYGLALDAAWQEAFGHRTEIYVNDDCVVIMLPEEIAVEEVLTLVNASNLDGWLRRRLEGSGFFGARFREAAGNALLITRNKAGQRLPLWLSRMRAKKLFESVQRFGNFPLLLEAWRTCLKDEFDMEALRQVLGELDEGEIAVSQTRTARASPFAASVAWRQINDEYMYATDEAPAGGASNLREDLVRALAFDELNRPRVPEAVVRDFEARRQRTAPGYAPTDPTELKEWLRDRIALSREEWERLVSDPALADGFELGELTTPSGLSGEGPQLWVYLKEEEDRVLRLFQDEPDPDLLVEWLGYYGPAPIDRLARLFGGSRDGLLAALDALVDERRVVTGLLVEGAAEEAVCEAENFEILLRLNRARNRGSIDPLPLDRLGLFLAEWQGVVSPGRGVERLGEALDQLLGWAAPVEEWEQQLLAVRVDDYQPALLDSVLLEDGWLWHGAGEGRTRFSLEADWPLVGTALESTAAVDETQLEALALLQEGGRYGFERLRELSSLDAASLEQALWSLVWSGRASNDAFAAARRGASGAFKICQQARQESLPPRPQRFARRARQIRSVTYPGSWFALPEAIEPQDAVEALDLARERARVLLDRYGVVFKELLQREQPGFRWGDVFKALRLLELSGEVVGGRFFQGVPGLQFVSKAALRRLRQPLPESKLYWLAASDPASLCGIGLEGLKGLLPARRAGVALAFRGAELVLEAHRSGKSLVFHLAPEDPDLTAIACLLEEMLDLGRGSLREARVEEINGADARNSPYCPALEACLTVHRDHKQLIVRGRSG